MQLRKNKQASVASAEWVWGEAGYERVWGQGTYWVRQATIKIFYFKLFLTCFMVSVSQLDTDCYNFQVEM